MRLQSFEKRTNRHKCSAKLCWQSLPRRWAAHSEHEMTKNCSCIRGTLDIRPEYRTLDVTVLWTYVLSTTDLCQSW